MRLFVVSLRERVRRPGPGLRAPFPIDFSMPRAVRMGVLRIYISGYIDSRERRRDHRTLNRDLDTYLAEIRDIYF